VNRDIANVTAVIKRVQSKASD